MRRRRLLLALAVTGSSILSGCSDSVSVGAESAGSTSTRSPASPSVSATVSGGEPESCPPMGASVVCHQSGEPDAPVVLVPSMRSVSLSGETVGFTLQNRSDGALSFRPYGWELWRQSDRWDRVAAGEGRPAMGRTVLSPGGSYAWQVAVGPVTVTATRPPVTVNDVAFESGRYAFAVQARGKGTHVYAAAFAVTE